MPDMMPMFARRGSMEGQFLMLAVAKWIGTLAPTILMGVLIPNALVLPPASSAQSST